MWRQETGIAGKRDSGAECGDKVHKNPPVESEIIKSQHVTIKISHRGKNTDPEKCSSFLSKIIVQLLYQMLRMENHYLSPSGSLRITRGHEQDITIQCSMWRGRGKHRMLGSTWVGTHPKLGGRERSWGAFWRGCQLPLHLEDVQLAVRGASEKE